MSVAAVIRRSHKRAFSFAFSVSINEVGTRQQLRSFSQNWGPGAAILPFLAARDTESGFVALESCVQMEDVADLKGGAVVHHEVAADNNVYVVWRRRRKHCFQLARARLHLFLQARRQSSIHDQLALESGRETIAFGQARGQMIVVTAVPVADISVMGGIAVMTMPVTVSMPMSLVTIVVGAVIVVTIMLVVAVAIALGYGDGAGERQRQQCTCANAE